MKDTEAGTLRGMRTVPGKPDRSGTDDSGTRTIPEAQNAAGGPDGSTAEDPRVETLAEKLQGSRRLLSALGDETRQYLMLEMMKTGDCTGIRAADLADRTNLSRPAVSHHLQIMKDAGLLKTRKEGTKIFYYFDPDMKALHTLIDALRLGMQITGDLPDRSGED